MAEPDTPRWPRLQFRCPHALIDRMDAAAARLDVPRQQLIRDAIAAHLDLLERP